MVGQTTMKAGDHEFVPLRYDDFKNLRARVEPLQPWVAVPFYEDIRGVVAETRAATNRFEEFLLGQGFGGIGSGTPGPRTISYQDKLRLSLPFPIFRGDKDKGYGIRPTRYRFRAKPTLETIRERIQFEARCAEKMKHYLSRYSTSPISDEQSRAAARHYGAPSSFVDFSFNPEVATFFADHGLTTEDQERTKAGIVYCLDVNRLQQVFGMDGWVPSPDGGHDTHSMNVFRVWQIPYLSCDPAGRTLEEATLKVQVPAALTTCALSIRTRAVPGIVRISAQEGLFLEANFERPENWQAQVFLWAVLDFIANKWCFRHQGSGYENPACGISRKRLFPGDDPELRDLTKDFRNWV